MVTPPLRVNPGLMADELELGWWRASDGYWYPAEARPGELWTGVVRGPRGEQPPGPGWWLASDYQWYPPDARPGELWLDPVAADRSGRRSPYAGQAGYAGRSGATGPRSAAVVGTGRGRRSRDVFVIGLGVALIVVGIAILAVVKAYLPDAGTSWRLAAWSPVAVGSSVTLIGAVRHLGLTG